MCKKFGNKRANVTIIISIIKSIILFIFIVDTHLVTISCVRV